MRFKKGQTPWNKGKKWVKMRGKNNPNWKKKIRKECEVCFKRFYVLPCRKSQRFCSIQCADVFNLTGENNPNWIGGGWLYVRKQILIEQDYTCQVCGLRDPEIMEVNHKLSKTSYPELARDKNNLEVLCPNCHRRKTNFLLKTKGKNH